MSTKGVGYYETSSGKSPFLDWINSLDIKNQVIVDRYIQRVAQGGAKKSIKSLKDGVFEIKISHSSGIRVYFGMDGTIIILLLLGGDKGSQKKIL